jgi:hypothetical protein
MEQELSITHVRYIKINGIHISLQYSNEKPIDDKHNLSAETRNCFGDKVTIYLVKGEVVV